LCDGCAGVCPTRTRQACQAALRHAPTLYAAQRRAALSGLGWSPRATRGLISVLPAPRTPCKQQGLSAPLGVDHYCSTAHTSPVVSTDGACTSHHKQNRSTTKRACHACPSRTTRAHHMHALEPPKQTVPVVFLHCRPRPKACTCVHHPRMLPRPLLATATGMCGLMCAARAPPTHARAPSARAQAQLPSCCSVRALALKSSLRAGLPRQAAAWLRPARCPRRLAAQRTGRGHRQALRGSSAPGWSRSAGRSGAWCRARRGSKTCGAARVACGVDASV
jgi:hypothetical protein